MNYFETKRLRLVQKGYENYNGPIGEYEFRDGISVEEIPLAARDRLSAAFQMVVIEADGEEFDASVAARLIKVRDVKAVFVQPLTRQTPENKLVENIAAIVGGEAVKPLYTVEALEHIAGAGGIAALREVAELWDVRSKSIPDLIALISTAQSKYRNERTEALLGKGVAKDDLDTLFALKGYEKPVEDSALKITKAAKPVKTVKAEPELDAKAIAAQNGDLAVALNEA